MNIQDLESLKLCLDTGDIDFFHGELSEAFVEVVDELHSFKTHLLDHDTVEEMAKELSEVLDEKEEFTDSRVETLKDCVVTYDAINALHTLKSPDNHAVLTLESDDISDCLEYEIIVRVVR